MGSEERVIRPYLGLARVERVLERTHLFVTKQHRIDPGERLSLNASEFLALPVQLWLAKDEAGAVGLLSDLTRGLEECGVPTSNAELVVVLSTPRLKLAEIAFRHRLDSPGLPVHIDLVGESRPAPLRTAVGGCRVDVYIVLAGNSSPSPLRPWRKGTWLAHARFELTTELGEVGFVPLPLTQKERRLFGLPEDTVRYAIVEDPLSTAGEPGAIELYIDEDILNELAHRPSSPAARSFQRQLFLDAMTALVLSAAGTSDLGRMTWGDVEDTLLGRLLRRLAGSTADHTEEVHRHRCEQLLDDVVHRPHRVVASVESIVPGLRSSIIGQLRGDA